MPGIDLIDLSDPLLRQREENALRLITHPEDKYPDHLGFWYLWTAKEAVFKLQRELTNFDPKEIPIHIDEGDAEITFSSSGYEGFFIKEDHVIIAIAMEGDEEIDYQVLKCEDKNQSTSIRKAAVDYLKENYQTEATVESDGDGLPVFSVNKEPLSLTHHYHYMAFAFDSRDLKSSQSH